MAEKTLNGRIVHKHDTEAHWLLAENFIPKQGEIIVYDVDGTHPYERLKVGDGVTIVSDLPFIDDIKGNHVVTATTTNNSAYTATVPGITSLKAGVSFVMLPSASSTSGSPTLNVNGLGAKQIMRAQANNLSDTATTNITANTPHRVIYNGVYWIVENMPKYHATDLVDVMPIQKGGTGADTAEEARMNLGVASQADLDELATTIGNIRMTRHAIILTDEVNGCDYAITIRNGNLVSSPLANEVQIQTQPTKTSYVAGELFDPTGMEIVATYPDGSTRVIEEYTCSTDIITLSTESVPVLCIVSGQTYSFNVDITVTELDASQLVDFEYTVDDGVYTLTAWKGTVNGVASTEMVVPDLPVVIALEG